MVAFVTKIPRISSPVHRCIAILGPAIPVSYRDPSIAIHIVIPQVAHHHTSSHVRDTRGDVLSTKDNV